MKKASRYAEWTPCMERLSKVGEKVLTCTRDGNIEAYVFRIDRVKLSELNSEISEDDDREIKDYSFYSNNEQVVGKESESFCNSVVNSQCFDVIPDWCHDPVIAWMPLPEKYKL